MVFSSAGAREGHLQFMGAMVVALRVRSRILGGRPCDGEGKQDEASVGGD